MYICSYVKLFQINHISENKCQPMRSRLLTNFDLSKIGNCTDKTVDFDLSRISFDQINPLISTLEYRGINELTSISLNFNLLKRTKARDNSRMQSKSETRTSKSRITQPYALEMSAVGRRKNLTQDISCTLFKIISESNSLLKLNLRSIPFAQQDYSVIFNAFQRAHSLRSLHLYDLQLGDEGFEVLCRCLKCELINDLQCRKCRLTDLSAKSLKSLISYHVSLQSEIQWRESLGSKGSAPLICLTKIDLRDNEFSYILIKTIHDDILDLPLSVLDLRGNIGITDTVICHLQEEIPYAEIKTGVTPPVKKKKNAAKRKKKTKKLQSKKKRLEDENERLRGLVDTLNRGPEIVEIEPDLKIVGPRASELAEHIMQLDAIISSIDKGSRPFFEVNERENQRNTKKEVRKKSVPKKRKPVRDFSPTPMNVNTVKRTRRSNSISRRPNH